MSAEQWAIYWWSISESTREFLTISGVVILVMGPFIGSILWSESSTEKIGKVTVISGLVIGILNLILSVFIPSKQDLALIFAYPYMKAGVEQAAQSETVKKLTTISTKYLDKVIADLEKANDHQ